VRYPFKTKPYAHQLEGMKFAFRQFAEGLGVGLLFEPRTGKTKTTIDIMSALHMKRPAFRKVLIIAPNRVLGTWAAEFHTHCPLVFEMIVWDAKERQKGVPRQPQGYTDLQILVTNFDAFGTPGRKLPSGRRSRTTGRFKNRDLIRKWLGDDEAMIVVDESHKLKNPSGKASNMIVGMRSDFRYHMILTGTPITKARRAADIYMQWRLINPKRFMDWGATYEDFRLHTGKWIESNGFPQWVRERPQGMRDLRAGIHRDALVVKRDECFDLPPVLPDRIIPVKLTTSGKHYDEMARLMVTELETGETAEAGMALIMALRLAQITSGHVGIMEPHPTNPNKQVSRPVGVGTEKLNALKDILVEDAIDKDEPIVIVAKWKYDLDAIQRLCTTLDIPWWSIRGGMTRDATDDALRSFKRAATSGVCAMIVQPQAGGVGVDMRSAHQMVWYSLTASWVDYTQMRDRIALAERATQHTFLLSPGTIDELMYQTLLTDGDVAKAVLKRPQSLLRRSTTRR
jgi:SNF2 family DNA or RNA helicase